MTSEPLGELYRTRGYLHSDRCLARAVVIDDCTSQGFDVWKTRHMLEARTANIESEIAIIDGEILALELRE